MYQKWTILIVDQIPRSWKPLISGTSLLEDLIESKGKKEDKKGGNSGE